MSNDPRHVESDRQSRSTAITRRDFGAAVGIGAVGPAFHTLLGRNSASAAPVQQTASELCDMSAVELATRLRRKQVSAREVMDAHLRQIERVNPRVNAIVTLVAEQALANAGRADESITRRGQPGVLHG